MLELTVKCFRRWTMDDKYYTIDKVVIKKEKLQDWLNKDPWFVQVLSYREF